MHRRLILGLAAFAGIATAMPAFTAAAYAQPVERREAVQHAAIHRAAPMRHRKIPTRAHKRTVAHVVRHAL